jgi:hypothetical protein
MSVGITNSMLTEKALDYTKLSDLAYAIWEKGVLKYPQDGYAHYIKLWDELSSASKGYTFVDQYTDPTTGYSGVIFTIQTLVKTSLPIVARNQLIPLIWMLIKNGGTVTRLPNNLHQWWILLRNIILISLM